jgi:ribosome-associated protein
MDDTFRADTPGEASAEQAFEGQVAADQTAEQAFAGETSAESPDEQAVAVELGRLLKEHKGGDVVVMDLRPLSMWTDFFVIASVSSSVHLSGLQRQIKEFAVKNGLPILRGQKKTAPGDGWDISDLGFIVVHIMTETSRSFYELEKLWSGGISLAL